MNQRIKWIDYLKGFLILTVMFGHTFGIPNALKVYIYSFHMPLFFILSGYTMSVEKYSFKEFLAKKFKALILSGLIFMIPLSMWEIYLLHFRTFTVDGFINGVLLGIRGGDLGIPWFLVCLFVCELILYIMIKGIKDDKCTLLLVTMLSIANYMYIRFIGSPFKSKVLPFCFDIVGISILLIYIGYFIKQKKFEIKKDRNLYMINFFAISICTCILNYIKAGERVDIYTYRIGSYLLFMVSAISGSIACIMLFKKIRKAKILEYIGKNSLIYYVFHYTLFVTFTKILIELKVREFLFSPILSAIYIVAGVILIAPIVQLINWVKAKKLRKISKLQTINLYVKKLEN